MTRHVGLAIICAGFAAHAVWLQCVAEDAFITYRFARNVAEGHGFVWNIGEAPVEGFTNFLWVIVCAALYRIDLDLPRITQAIGVGAGLATLLVSWRFATSQLRLRDGVALFGVAMIAAAGPLATWASSGMETVWFAMCICIAVERASCAVLTRTSGAAFVAAAALFAATLTRPEGLGVAVLVLSTAAISAGDSRTRRQFAEAFTAYAAAFALYFAWRYATFGYALPNTFYAKTGGGLHQYWRGTLYLAHFALHFVLPWLPWLVVLGWWTATRRAPLRAFDRLTAIVASRSRHPGLLVAAVVVAGYAGYVVLVGGDYMAMYRFVVPVLPLIYLLLARIVEAAVDVAAATSRGRLAVAASALITASGILLQSTPYEQALFPPTPQMHGTYRGVSIERRYVNRFHVIARFFASQMPERSGSILTWDIGVVGYVTRFRIDDALGIVDPVIAHQPAPATMGLGLAGHEKQNLPYSYSRNPTFVMYTVQLRPSPANWPRYPPDLDAYVRGHYDLKSAWLVDDANREAGYFTYLERKR